MKYFNDVLGISADVLEEETLKVKIVRLCRMENII